MQKITTPTVERRWTDGDGIKQWNGGMHNQRANKMKQMLIQGKEDFARPRLYHLILTMIMDNAGTAAEYQAALKAICFKLTDNGIENRWKACLERDERKGLHFHVFILLNDKGKINPDEILHNRDTSWLNRMLEQRGMKYTLAHPKSDIHEVQTGINAGNKRVYATLATNKHDKLADCIEWISYLAKARSKPDDIKQIYFSSRDRKPTKHASGNNASDTPLAA
jgi:hypothetical protein